MNNKRATKRALLTSVMALVMCVVMLVGTTFAWFTDTASTAVNKIQSGTLKVDIVKEDGLTSIKNDSMSFVNKDGSANILWEPGATFMTPAFKIKSTGSLALKYKLTLNGITGDNMLLDVITFSVVKADGTEVALDTFVGHLTPDAALSDALYIKGHMDEAAGNDYQNKTLEGLGITVVATQDTVENDSVGNQYDKDAPIVYPAGVTTESFAQATSVYYYGTYGGGSNIREATGDEIANHPAAVAYVDASGVVKYAADVYCAVANGATTVYCKENATVKMRWTDTNRTQDLTKDLTVYANGADFQYGEIALNSTTTAAKDITVKVYDAKNLYIWGYSPAGDKALTVLMENCHNVGVSETEKKGRMFYISNDSNRANGTIHATLRNCSVEKSDSPVYMNADGSLTLEGCRFTQCAVPVNNNYKSNGTRTDAVKNCTFIRCGCTAEMHAGISSYAAPIRFVKSGSGTLNVTLENNTFTNTIGTNGDILLGDYRETDKSFAFDTNITTDQTVMVKSSAAAAYSSNGGKITTADY